MSEWGKDRNRKLFRGYREFVSGQGEPVPWRWGGFNESFGNMVPGWVFTIGGRPGNGKTTLLMNQYTHFVKTGAALNATVRLKVPGVACRKVRFFPTSALPTNLGAAKCLVLS